MDRDLPEEILCKILEFALYPTPLDCFFDESPLVCTDELGGPLKMPRTTVLLVCKQWLRIATPILYRYVRLFKAEQVKKLTDVLSANPELGQMVRHLRLQGGYGWDLSALMKYMSRVETLSVHSRVLSNESNVGLLEALPRLNPVRLYIHESDNYLGRSVNTDGIRQAISRAIPRWTALERVYICKLGAVNPELTSALRDAPSLKVISMDALTLGQLLKAHRHLFENQNLEAIHCRSSEEYMNKILVRIREKIPEGTKSLVRYKCMKGSWVS